MDSQLNINYQAHPVASLIGSIIPGIIAGFGFYWLSSWRAKRKQEKLKQVVDDKFYDEVSRELQGKSMVAGLWTKAYAEMNGDEAKTQALYIKYRVVQLKNESESKEKRPPKLSNIHRPNPIFVVFFIVLTLFFGMIFLLFLLN